MINAGVIGVGSIGVHHARIYSGLDGVTLFGIADPDSSKAAEIASRYNCRSFTHYRELLDEVDAVSIAAPTPLHFEIARTCIQHDKHLLIEKPITSTIEEADVLIEEAAKRGLVLQVGHLERFNAGVSLISTMVEAPQFIESQRMSPFLGRSADVDVTLDLMIHDIDIILSLVDSEIVDLRATGAKVLTDNIDVAHAWIEFANGCVAEAVTSRIAAEKVRRLKIFQHNAYLDLDYQSQEVTCQKNIHDHINREIKKPEEKEPLREQLRAFMDCIRHGTQPVVSGREGKEALNVALRISRLVHHGLSF